MLFNSYVFIFAFLPIVFFCYFFLLRKRLVVLAKASLISASLFFYAWWNISYLPILVFSLLFNFSIGNTLQGQLEAHKRKLVLMVGVIANLSILGYFKYADFLIDNINIALESKILNLDLLLPLAISFFTFQQIAYLVDCYRNEAREYDFLNYTLFVTFFPQLIAGPIVHHREMMPQFMSNRWNLRIKYQNISAGLFIFSLGLFKKVVIADAFSVIATNGFDHAITLNILESWVTSLSYTFQLYFDFSGYTDMAIGAALLFNIRLPVNFNSPYKAQTIQDFWRRWHITLSRFLRDYVYIPLGGSRVSNLLTSRNLMATFLLGGLWHGAGWTFVVWGGLHGLALVFYRVWTQVGFKLNKYVAWFVTFNFINISWVFFRAKDFSSAIKVLSGMFFGELVLDHHWKGSSQLGILKNVSYGPWLQNILAENKIFIYLLVSAAVVFMAKNSNQMIEGINLRKRNAFAAAGLFSYSILSMNKASEFLYFNF